MGEADALKLLAGTLAHLNFTNSLLVDADRLRSDAVSAIGRNAQAFEDLASVLNRSAALMTGMSARRDRFEATARRASTHAVELRERCDVLRALNIDTPRPDAV